MGAIWVLLGGIIGLVAGSVAVGIVLNRRFREQDALIEATRSKADAQEKEAVRLQAQLEQREAYTQELAGQIAAISQERDSVREQYHKLDVALNKERSEIDVRERAIAERLEDLQKFEERFRDTFANLSNEAVKKGGEELLKRYEEKAAAEDRERRQGIEKLLEPLSADLKRLEEFNRILNEQRLQDKTMLSKEIESLATVNSKLVNALQGSGPAGMFGEGILEQLIESAGFTHGVNYFRQGTLETEDGRQRPDYQIVLAGGRRIIIDAKSPVHEFATGATEQSVRDYGVALSRKVLEYAKNLNKRDYAKHEEAPDFTIMFIPSESLFRYALEGRPSLIEDTRALNVIIASPTTLLAMLRVIMVGWQHQALADEARNIQGLGKSLYDAVLSLATEYEKLGKQLCTATQTYNRLGGKIETTVLSKARKMSDAGIQAKDSIAPFEDIDFEPRQLNSPVMLHAQLNQQLSLEP